MTSELPSQVEETLAICPRFRIVLVGNTGVGKSSLVEAVFNIVFNVHSKDGITIDIADDRVGKADINHEYYSDQNPRFILHDSMGFEPGSTEKSEIVKSFLQKRAESNVNLSEQVHAIWLCIETPRTGSRLLQTGDEELLELAKQLKIPVIIVFTKYDILFVEHFRASSHIPSKPDRKTEARKRADKAFNNVTKQLQVPFVAVSTNKEFNKGTMLVKLTQVTRDHLRDVAGSLWALWATAQQINAHQKVELSISEGLKKYWRDLGENVLYQGHRLGACISRIHDDVLKVWNFNDPEKLLSGEEFLAGMIRLVEPLRDAQAIPYQANKTMDLAANTASAVGAISSTLVLPALGTLVGTVAFQFLLYEYRKGASTATYLAAYVVDLISVLYEISMVLTADPPRSLTRNIVQDALATYKSGSAVKVHEQVKQAVLTVKFEDKIVKVIRDTLHM